MQTAPSLVSALTGSYNPSDATGEASSTRFAGKRTSLQTERSNMQEANKRAAFHDLTNSEKLNSVLLLQVPDQGMPHHTKSHSRTSQPRSIPSDVATSKTSGHRKLTLRTPAAPTFVDIDVDNGAEQSACIAYAPEIFAHLREAEIRHRPCTTYMESRQTDINAAMRSILVDWLVEVAQEYRLTSDTLFLSVAIIDRYLSVKDVKRNRLQLLGVSAMLIASKYEEIYAPQVDEFCFITDNTYSREAVLEMERDLLNELGFELTQPTIKTFLRRYIKAASGEVQLDITFEFLCSYLAELALLDYGLLGHLPSKVAAGCVMLALYLLGKPRWSATLQHYSGYAPCDLQSCVHALHQLFLRTRTSALPASREKYSSPRLGAVSAIGAPETLPDWLFH